MFKGFYNIHNFQIHQVLLLQHFKSRPFPDSNSRPTVEGAYFIQTVAQARHVFS
jgi:hypothetical protein